MFKSILLTFLFISLPVYSNEFKTQILEINPGQIDFNYYIPKNVGTNPPLVIVLHGCKQKAIQYTENAGWKKYADKWGFILLSPGQREENNEINCFNWFQPEDARRDKGELASIAEMVNVLIQNENIDRNRIFISGLSAGAAMANAFAVNYPDIIAGVNINAGVPYGCAMNAYFALSCMEGFIWKFPMVWSSYVKHAINYKGPWPKVSIWHGDQDKRVKPINALNLVHQWTGIHNAKLEKVISQDKYSQSIYKNERNQEVIHLFKLKDVGHVQAINSGEREENCGSNGPYVQDSGICASYFTSLFFELDK